MANTPKVAAMEVYPVAGKDCMELNLSGAHAPYFTRNIVVLTDDRGNTGIGEVPGGQKITRALENVKHLVEGTSVADYKMTLRRLNEWLTANIKDDVRGQQTFDLRTGVHVVTAVETPLLDLLGQYQAKATFFVVGNWADQYPQQAKAIVESGCELMNHSNAHDHYNSLTADQIIADVNTCNDKIEALTGVRPTLIRCPFGEYDDHVISTIRSIGMEPIQWDVEALAAVGRRKSMKK